MSFENMMNIFKNKFWLFGDFDRFSPVQWMTLKQQWASALFQNVSAQASKSWMLYKMFYWKLCFQTHIFA